ncbi:MAG: hypothetical protein DRH12_09760 [Deltaproteobacteria bacterium]|nr:MAG: hypothetical protein DRH12_09760 [Deltaproteobacteria bacterium]
MKRLLSFIDTLSVLAGKVSGWLIFIVAFLIIYEVASRYIFHHPTLWVTESVIFGCGISYVLGAGWALQDNRHVKIDMIYDRLNTRRRAIMDSITFVFFVLYLGVLLWASIKYSWHSLLVRETSGSAWDPPIYPVKLALPLGIIILLLQGIAKFFRDLSQAIKGSEK